MKKDYKVIYKNGNEIIHRNYYDMEMDEERVYFSKPADAYNDMPYLGSFSAKMVERIEVI